MAMMSTKKGKEMVTSRRRHQQHIDDAAEIARGDTDGGADDEGKEDAEDAHLEIEPGAPDDPREDVAAEIVGAEEMDRIGRLQLGRQILRDGVIGRQPGRRQRQYQPEQAERAPDIGQQRGRAQAAMERGAHDAHGPTLTAGSGDRGPRWRYPR